MLTVYFYVLDTLADWEAGAALAELHSKRYFRKDAPDLTVKTVGISKEPIKTMGGLTLLPDCVVEDIIIDRSSILILPGADTWNDPKHSAILKKAEDLLKAKGTVCAICGATAALANTGLLDARPHTSNGPGFLDMFCPNYKGQALYVDQPAVTDRNLITAGCTGSLLWAKQILAHLDVLKPDTLNAWYEYFSDGTMEHFYALMQTLQP